MQGDLGRPETLPAALVGIHTVIDCATGRPEEPIRKVDWDGKVALIETARAMGVQRFVFYSIHNCDKHPEVPLMEMKRCVERFLVDSGLDYTTIRLCGFMQARPHWPVCRANPGGEIGVGHRRADTHRIHGHAGASSPLLLPPPPCSRFSKQRQHLALNCLPRADKVKADSEAGLWQDIARLTFAALRKEDTIRKTFTLAGPRAWTSQEVIALCERLAGQDAKVTTVPLGVLKATRFVTRLFQWTADVADRLAFSEVLTSDTVFSAPMGDTYSLLGVDAKEVTTLERYLQEYYIQILKKLKDLRATSKQGDYYL
eukprot:SM000064S19788  [mRNA]  locus=s64:525948:527084:+ [translate_table: standard]